MAESGQKQNHMERTELTDAKIKDFKATLSLFGKWLEGARFEIADPKKSENLITHKPL
ncbi:MAG: hypothetical protein Q9163_004501 [Psora crenata]